MDEEYDYQKIKEVGRISHEALEYSKKVVKEGRNLLEIAEEIEKFIKGKGFEMAFPVNLSINENAAHYTPTIDEKYSLVGNEVIKVDLGARKDAYLGDCAITIDLSGEHSKLVEAAENALEDAISMVKAGREVREIGRTIDKVATHNGFKPIRNLGGHGVEKLDLHASVFVPNFDNGDATRLEEGQVIAIEPFLTNGFGYVEEGEIIEIFQKNGEVSLRANESREISDFITKNYSTYPFARRWLEKHFKSMGEFKIRKALNDLAATGALEVFPVLIEKKKGMVAQAEKEMIVTKDSCEIVTK